MHNYLPALYSPYVYNFLVAICKILYSFIKIFWYNTKFLCWNYIIIYVLTTYFFHKTL